MDKLDDLKLISTIDRKGMLHVLDKVPEICFDALKIGKKIEVAGINEEITRILFVGMGGSSIGASLFKDWAINKATLPMDVCRDYILPEYVDKHTLVFLVSYSGDTEETLNALLQSLKRQCPIIGLSSGGLLEKLCLKKKVTHIKIPEGFQPRAALPYLFISISKTLEKLGIVEGVDDEADEAIETLRRIQEKIKVSIQSDKNDAKRIALNIIGTIPVIYGYREFTNVAYRLKTQLNENSKILSKFETFPELDHNEVVGWSGTPTHLTNLISVILIRDTNEPEEIKTRIEITKKIISEKTNRIFEIYAEGETKMARMLSTIYYGDFISFYLAILNGVDPTPVDIIKRMKQEIEEKTGLLQKIKRQSEL
ncbi:MAG: bifunctional phosphoglucose/phosphomannose isomerase [Candidatus Bathyarchaeota archaeon]